MVKLLPSITISESKYRGCLDLKFDYRFEELRDDLKNQCLAIWDSSRKVWIVGADHVNGVVHLAEHYGLGVSGWADGKVKSIAPVEPTYLPTDLYPFQRAGICNSLTFKSYMLSFDTGLGKSRTALEILQRGKCYPALIVCPASVQYNWKSEIEKWGLGHLDVEVFDTGAKFDDAKFNGTDFHIAITSWSLLHKLKLEISVGYKLIIFDELHYAAGRNSQRAEAALRIREENPDAIILGLTATPILSEVEDLWHQLHLLYPNRFGTYWQFVRRYCRTAENQWGGLDVLGLNMETAHELEARVRSVSLRVTKEEVSKLLPPFTARPIRVTSSEKTKLKSLTEEFDGLPEHKAQLDNFVSKAGSLKVDAAVEHAGDLIKSGQRKIAVLTYFRDTALILKEELEGDFTVVHVDGSVDPKQRAALLDTARGLDQCILIATMSSIAEGIDLTAFNHVVFAELYWQPSLMTQVMGRFHRLNGKMPVSVDFLILRGTLDEIIAKTLLRRSEDSKAILAQSTGDKALSDNLKAKEQTHDEVITELREAAASLEQDEYL